MADDCKEDKKAKGTKNVIEVILKSQQRFKNVYTENINKIALSNNDDKRIVSSGKITSYPYGYKGKNAII